MPRITFQVDLTNDQLNAFTNRMATGFPSEKDAAENFEPSSPPVIVSEITETGAESDARSAAETVATALTSVASNVDDRGVPWHKDHHAGTKTKNVDGSWKAIRMTGTDDEKAAKKAAAAAYEAPYLDTTPAVAAPAAPAVAAVAPTAPVEQVDTDSLDIPEFLKRDASAVPTAPPVPPAVASPIVATPPAPPVPPAAPPAVAPPIPETPAPAAPVSFDDVMATYAATQARVTDVVVNANLSAIYDSIGAPQDGSTLTVNETHRVAFVAALNALQPTG